MKKQLTPIDKAINSYLGSGYIKQMYLNEQLSNSSWNIDVSKNQLIVNNKKYLIQILGSFSNQSGTFLQGWKNESLPKDITKDSLALRKYGVKNKLPMFSVSQYEDSEELSLIRGIIASEITDSYGFFDAEHENGIVTVLIKGNFRFKTFTLKEIIKTITEVISTLEIVDHFEFIKGFLIREGFKVTSNADSLSGTKGRDTGNFKFDNRGRVISMSNK